MRSKLAIGVVAAGLALTACGSVNASASGAKQSHARTLSPQQVQQTGLSVSDIKDLATAKLGHGQPY
jgi:hypothetical protein